MEVAWLGRELYKNCFRKFAYNKSVFMDSIAASGGYLIAVEADYTVANIGRIAGSIGVLMEMTEITESAHKIGVKYNHSKSNALKAQSDFTEKLIPENKNTILRSCLMCLIFNELVAERRDLDLDFSRENKRIKDFTAQN